MKKLLLSALCAVTAILGSAQSDPTTATWNFIVDRNNYTKPLTSPVTLNTTSVSSTGKWTFTYTSNASSQNDANNGPKFGSKNDPVTAATFALSESDIPTTATITKVMFTVKGGAKGALSSWNLEIGGKKVGETQTTTKNDNATVVTDLTWDNVNTVGNQIAFVLAATSTNGFHLQKVEVTYTTDGKVLESAGLAFPETSYTVEFGQEFTKPELTNPYGLTIQYESSDETVATVDKNTGDVTIVGGGKTTISAKSEANDTYAAGNASYELNVEKKVATFEEIYAQGKNVEIEVGFPMVVTYISGSNYFVKRVDADDYSLIYSNGLTYKVGDIIPAGWTCKYSPYGQTPEIVPAGATMPTATETTEVTYPKVSTITAADVNRIVVIENVTFTDATSSTKRATFTGTVTVDDMPETINFYVQFDNTPAVAAGAYDVTCAVSTYDGPAQAYPISYVEHVSTSIREVVTTGLKNEMMFDLQGRRVVAPRKGQILIQNGRKVRF